MRRITVKQEMSLEKAKIKIVLACHSMKTTDAQ